MKRSIKQINKGEVMASQQIAHTPWTVNFSKIKCFHSIDSPFFEEGNFERNFYTKASALPLETSLQESYVYSAYHKWYKCIQCPKMLFPTKFYLDLHISESHDPFFAIKSEQMSLYRCFIPTCNSMFQTPQQRYNHMHNIHACPRNYHLHLASNFGRKKWKEKNREEIEKSSQMEGVYN
jgi:hypothetical protein